MRINLAIQLLLILVLSFLSSCRKVIHLELNTASPQLVIQGNIYDHGGPYFVKISKSVNFDESGIYPAVSGATVIINDSFGNSDHLTEIEPGTYRTTTLTGTPGMSYSLQVTIGDQSYASTSTMPMGIEIAELNFQKSLFGNSLLPVVNFSDPPNITNYYRLIYFINGIQQDDINVTDDRLSAGQIISYVIRPIDTDNILKSGDKVTIWLESIDQGVYEYFRTAGRERGQSASPANPISNISNGALGYFSASSCRIKSADVR